MYFKDFSTNTYFDAYGTTFTHEGNTYAYSVKMGDGFMTQLRAPLNFKDAIENNCRLKNGITRIVPKKCVDARDMTLTFQICADTREEANIKLDRLYSLFYNGKFDIATEGIIYHLEYLGNNSTFAHSPSWSTISVTAKFKECDPTDRHTYKIVDGALSVLNHFNPFSPDENLTYALHIDISPSGAGSVTPNGGTFEKGNKVILRASANRMYEFSHWSSGETTPMLSVTMDEDKFLTAYFKTRSMQEFEPLL